MYSGLIVRRHSTKAVDAGDVLTSPSNACRSGASFEQSYVKSSQHQDSPRSMEHRPEVRIVARKMEDGVADDHVRVLIGEGHLFDRLD
jgi:hypothetical protein